MSVNSGDRSFLGFFLFFFHFVIDHLLGKLCCCVIDSESLKGTRETTSPTLGLLRPTCLSSVLKLDDPLFFVFRPSSIREFFPPLSSFISFNIISSAVVIVVVVVAGRRFSRPNGTFGTRSDATFLGDHRHPTTIGDDDRVTVPPTAAFRFASSL